MATININLSQNVVDQQYRSDLNTAALNSSLGSLVDAFSTVDYAIESNYSVYSAWSLVNSTMTMGYPDGAMEVFTGTVLSNPMATSGVATATGYQFTKSGWLTFSAAGIFTYDYSLAQAGTKSYVSYTAKNLSFSALRLETKLPSTSPDYDPLLGNVAIVVNGVVNIAPTGQLSGTIGKITTTADKFLLSGTIEGNFIVLGNLITDGQGLTHSRVTGVMTGYHENYRDGSNVDVTGLSAQLGAAEVLDDRAFGNSSFFGASDNISIELPGHLYRDFVMASGDGDDQLSIKGGGGRLNVAAGSGNDQITILGDAHTVDGGSGIDVVKFATARADFTVKKMDAAPGTAQSAPVYAVTDKAGTVSYLTNVERVVFSDATVALDFDGNGGQAYRLYQAAFNRTPDSGGLGFWIRALDGGMSLKTVAEGFVTSAEFKTAYGASPANRELVTQFYQNILHRTPEAGGLDFWVGVLESKAAGVPDVLAAISESAENKAALIGVIGNGFSFTPFDHS